jgi:DNA-binding LacI/PurR family transcriptional regulator
MATTIHDVARVAGVGIGTVSRVLNNNANVKPGTRERVLAAIQHLNYKPDPIARSMISKRTDAIGVIAPFFTRHFFMEVLQGAEAATTDSGKELHLYNVRTNKQLDHYFSELPMHRKVDGVLILSLAPEDEFARKFLALGLPVVLVDAYSPLLTSLVVNNKEGAYQAMMCLIRQGHRRIGFINGILEGFRFNQAIDRLQGVQMALKDAGLPFHPELIVETEWTREGGKNAALQLLSQAERPTAIFAASDIQAVGVLEAARELHIQVPDELAVIGFDGIELSELLQLSTMQQPMREMGALGIKKLIELIEHQHENQAREPELIWIQTELVERATTQAHSVQELTYE